MNSFDIIKTVRVTEKGTRQSDKLNQYTVVADRRANKTEIRNRKIVRYVQTFEGPRTLTLLGSKLGG